MGWKRRYGNGSEWRSEVEEVETRRRNEVNTKEKVCGGTETLYYSISITNGSRARQQALTNMSC